MTRRVGLPQLAWAKGGFRTVGPGLFAFWLILIWPGSASAQVEIGFHARAFGRTFPHALVVLRGTLEATGERVDANYGFTVRHQIGPSVLLGPVQGEIVSEPSAQAHSARQFFAMVLTDEEYRSVMEVVERWRSLPQPSYRLDDRNCVNFVADIATALGLHAVPTRATRWRPRAFLERVLRVNRQIIEARRRELAQR